MFSYLLVLSHIIELYLIEPNAFSHRTQSIPKLFRQNQPHFRVEYSIIKIIAKVNLNFDNVSFYVIFSHVVEML